MGPFEKRNSATRRSGSAAVLSLWVLSFSLL